MVCQAGEDLIVLADRAAISTAGEVTAGVPYLLDDTQKVFAVDDRFAIGLAGLGVVPGSTGPPLDLRREACEAVAGCADVYEAARAVHALLSNHRASLDAFAGPRDPADKDRALTICVVAGPSAHGPIAFQIAAYRDAMVSLATVDRVGHAWGPDRVQLDLEAAVLQAATLGTTAAALDRMVAAVRSSATRVPALLSLDADAVVVSSGGHATLRELRYQRPPPPLV